MGMYTGLSFVGVVKPDMLDELKMILDDSGVDRVWSKAVTPELKKFGDEVGRQSFIPFGSMAYMPDEWDNHSGSHIDGHLWTFSCSLKNYEDEISNFMTNIAPLVCIEYNAIEHYEELEEDYNELWITGDIDRSSSTFNGTIGDFYDNNINFDIEQKLKLLENYVIE